MNQSLPRALYTADAVKSLDRYAIDTLGIPGLTLMERAGGAAFAILRRVWPEARRLVVLCGTGNNGGDGFIVARLAREAGFDETVMLAGEMTRLQGAAKAAADRYREKGGRVRPIDVALLDGAEVIVDALLGTGLDREVTGTLRHIIDTSNAFSKPVLALDIPSGLHADTGCVMGAAMAASATVTFIGLKQGLLTADGPEYSGHVYFDDLAIPREVYGTIAANARRIDMSCYSHLLIRRAYSSHKGHFGHVLVIGGDHGYAGAARMAAEGAARAGAGLISLATRADHAGWVSAMRPEIMCHGVDKAVQLAPLIERASVLALGPGLGQSPWASTLMSAALDSGLPKIVDADALNLLAKEPSRDDAWILTPHPGEAARLLQTTPSQVQSDRCAAVVEIQRRYGGVCVLKGSGTVICGGDGKALAVCDQGNPGMASGGMGDVLTGVIAGLRAQGIPALESAELGVCLHAEAGDLAARDGQRGMLATDLLPWLHRLVNPATPQV